LFPSGRITPFAAQKISNDELGTLADAFNGMLSQIQLRETTLQQANARNGAGDAERNKAEKILGASEERFRRLLTAIPFDVGLRCANHALSRRQRKCGQDTGIHAKNSLT